jgi:hypothetical protein
VVPAGTGDHKLLDIGAKAHPSTGPSNHTRCGDFIDTQGGNECGLSFKGPTARENLDIFGLGEFAVWSVRRPTGSPIEIGADERRNFTCLPRHSPGRS